MLVWFSQFCFVGHVSLLAIYVDLHKKIYTLIFSISSHELVQAANACHHM